MTAGLRIDHYDWAGGREAMLRFGPEDGPVVTVALPLFEEANRTRAFAGAILRALAGLGIGGAVPDMPGQGESLIPLETLSLLRMQEGYEGAVDHLRRQGLRPYGVGMRSGALLDARGLVNGRWYLAPQGGPDLLRELRRVRQAGVTRPLREPWFLDPDLPADASDPPVEIAGNLISTDLLTDLTVKQPWTSENGGPVRVVRLASDGGIADRHVPGPPPWRRAEPASDAALAQLLADDIATWVCRCEG